jgi:hypothetical protein
MDRAIDLDPVSPVPKRGATLEYVRQATDNLHHHFAPLGALGDLDGYQWLLLLASHTERHVAQMDEVKAHPGYPGDRFSC